MIIELYDEYNEFDIRTDTPKYQNSLINLANKFSKATFPKGKNGEDGFSINELMEEFQENKSIREKNLNSWKVFFNNKKPKAINDVSKNIYLMLKNMRKVLNNLKENDVREWTEDLLFNKSYKGFFLQKKIIEHIADEFGFNYEHGNSINETEGIDGFLIYPTSRKRIALQIKPISFKAQQSGDSFNKDILFVYYKERKDGGFVLEYENLYPNRLILKKENKNILTRNKDIEWEGQKIKSKKGFLYKEINYYNGDINCFDEYKEKIIKGNYFGINGNLNLKGELKNIDYLKLYSENRVAVITGNVDLSQNDIIDFKGIFPYMIYGDIDVSDNKEAQHLFYSLSKSYVGGNVLNKNNTNILIYSNKRELINSGHLGGNILN